MKFREQGFASFASMTLIVGGIALGGLLAWGWISGQDLPLGPALAVAVVNVFAAIKLAIDTRNARQAPPPTSDATATTPKNTKRKRK